MELVLNIQIPDTFDIKLERIFAPFIKYAHFYHQEIFYNMLENFEVTNFMNNKNKITFIHWQIFTVIIICSSRQLLFKSIFEE